jgi:hypothetical protein
MLCGTKTLKSAFGTQCVCLLSSQGMLNQVMPELICYQTKRCRIVEDSTIHSHLHENLKSRTGNMNRKKRKQVVSRPPLWSSGYSSWLQIQRSGFDSRRYQTFWEVVGMERGPVSLVSTVEELLNRKSSGSGLKIREYGLRDPSRWPRDTLYPQNLALTSPTRGSRSVIIINSRTKAKECFK